MSFVFCALQQQLVTGLEEILPDKRVKIFAGADSDAFTEYSFVHSGIGANTLPISKIEAFEELMQLGFGKQADIAFFKFCFVDFNEETNIGEVFTHYKNSIRKLKQAYPETTFIHVTTPLIAKNTNVKTKLKNIVKPFLGKTVFTYKNNIYIHTYNQLLRSEYEKIEPIFDLAQIESTTQDGDRLFATINTEDVPFLYGKYTSDGGHLNSYGRKYIAYKLLRTIYDLLYLDTQ